MSEEEEFFAWLDGELHGEAADRVAARVAASPELSARAEQHRKLATGLRGAFDPVMEANIAPPIFQSADVIDFATRKSARETRKGWLTAPQWLAVAASLVVGVFAGQLLFPAGPSSPVAVQGGQLVAADELQRALDTQLASAPADEGARIGLTFRDAEGRICRSFTDAAVSGLACHDGGAWRIKGVFPAAEGQATDYRMAAGSDPRLASLIGETMAGEPFDSDQERAARESDWR